MAIQKVQGVTPTLNTIGGAHEREIPEQLFGKQIMGRAAEMKN